MDHPAKSPTSSSSEFKMIKPRTAKSLALLTLTAIVSNLCIDLLFSLDTQDNNYDDPTNAVSTYDTLLTQSRRLTLSPTKSRLSQIQSHHASLLIARGIDPNSDRFHTLLRERMRRVKVVREERGSERRMERGMVVGGEVWRGTRWMGDGLQKNNLPKKHRRDLDEASLSPQEICGRPTHIRSLEKFSLLHNRGQYTCPSGAISTGAGPYDVSPSAIIATNTDMNQTVSSSEYNPNAPSLLLLSGRKTFGRTGNNLIEFLHALQVARDKDLILGIEEDSWAMRVLTDMFMKGEGEERWEEVFCAKIIHSPQDLENYNVLEMTTKELFGYTSPIPYDQYVASTQHSIRSLFQNYNTQQTKKDMCSGINALFSDHKKTLYSVIHSRHLEGAPGLRLLSKVCRNAKCDPTAALEMRPDYIKSILRPLHMLQHPIVLITDGQDFTVIQRLMADKEIGPMLRIVPEEASWIGGDLTLGIMSNVFIGNPASTFSTFISKSRLSLGLGQSYLFRRKTAEGEWVTSCGDACVFDKRVMDVMS